MATTANGLRFPAGSDAPNGPGAIQNLAADVDTRLLAPITLRNAGRQSNNILANSSQAYGSSTAGRLVIPAATRTRLVRIDCDIDVYCGVASATAGSVRLFANSTDLLPDATSWGTFHNLVSTGAYGVRPATGHVRWEGTLPAAAQNIWVNVVADAASQAFWVTGFDLTVVYR